MNHTFNATAYAPANYGNLPLWYRVVVSYNHLGEPKASVETAVIVGRTFSDMSHHRQLLMVYTDGSAMTSPPQGFTWPASEHAGDYSPRFGWARTVSKAYAMVISDFEQHRDRAKEALSRAEKMLSEVCQLAAEEAGGEKEAKK